MRAVLEQGFFPYVIKPGRYAGGEPGQVVKDPSGRVNYLHIYPDKYEIGHSHLGSQTLYHLVNQDDRFLCERSFAPDTDAEALMRSKGVPLFSLESSRPAKEFDAVGFTLVDETVYTNMLAAIDLAGMALRAAERTDDDPIILTGGPAVYNPEPIAPFVDLCFIGDAEEGLLEILSVLHELKGQSKTERLEAIVRRVESVYVPRFYDVHRRPTAEFAPAKIKARVMSELKREFYPDRPLVPLIDTVHNHLAVEIMRGCPQGCRFCMAGPIYRPVRLREPAEIARQVETQLDASGYGEITLLSLSASDYPQIETLANMLVRKLEPDRIALSLPSLRPGSVSSGLMDTLRRVNRGGMTIAPEAGTERLRLFIRKDIPDVAVFDTARLAFEKNWATIKLYFMIGLPTESEADLRGIADMCRRIHEISRNYGGKRTINVTLSPFSPKPHTPFQWDAIEHEQAIMEKIKFVRRNIRLNQVHVKHIDTRLAMLGSIIGRGDRRMADVVEHAFRAGCRFDAWSEHFEYGKWEEALAACKIDINECLKPISFSTELPWSHIAKGVSTEHLMQERQRTSGQLRDYTPLSDDQRQSAAMSDNTAFGRGKRKVASRSNVAPTKSRIRLRWGKSARLRYMSHLDNMRLIERGLRIARLPVVYSQGFNPAMKLSFGPPLPLGVTSEAEYVDIILESTLNTGMLERLRQGMPEGVELYEARTVMGNSPSLSASLNRVVYCIRTEDVPGATGLADRASSLMAMQSLLVNRTSKETVKQVDIRPAIYRLAIDNGNITMELGLGEGGYAKPGEVITSLIEQPDLPHTSLRLHRKEMFRVGPDDSRTDAMEV